MDARMEFSKYTICKQEKVVIFAFEIAILVHVK
jgi:hypothetical protein